MILPYLELPVCLPGLEETGNPDKVVSGKFQPSQIVAYHESYYTERTMIYLANGQPFLLELSSAAYEDKIKSYWNLITRESKNKLKLV
jgi:hypothetical protein